MYMELGRIEFNLVECNTEYWEFVRELRNDSRVIGGFIETTYITPEMQNEYMKLHQHEYRIGLLYGKPVGYVGVIEDDIRVCTHPNYQKLGVGKFMINEAMKIWPTAFAKVKIDNTASLKLFESCGFTQKYVILTKD